MINGISFAKGVFFHNHKVISCAEVHNGVIHVWAEQMTFRTVSKMWYKILLSLPWYYHLFHAVFLFYLWNPWYVEINPLWFLVYLVGFHFVFPQQLKKFHGAEHKVFSQVGEKNLENIEEIRRASIVNSGCSTTFITYFFVFFLLALIVLPLYWSILVGVIGISFGSLGNTYYKPLVKPFHKLSAFLQRYVTTKEPETMHLEAAIRSYQLLLHNINK